MPKQNEQVFRATLERVGSRLNWVIIRIPAKIMKVWGTRSRLKVRGEINGFAFRTSLFPSRTGGHMMIVNKKMQAAAKVVAGSVAEFRMQPDTEERVAAVPLELKRLLAEDKSFQQWFGAFNYSTKKWIADWITGVKSAEARKRRAEQVAEQLLATMEAERELPPILRVAFARNPAAEEGWALMAPSRRRGHLLAIFYYRNPESRARRIEKVVQEAAAAAERKRK